VGDGFSGALARAVGEDVSSSYAINQGTLGNSNYAVTITSTDFAITARPIYVTADAGQSKVYGEADPTFAYTTAAKTTGAGLMGVYDGVTLTGALARANGSDVGTTYAINQGSLATSSGSNYSIQYTGANFAISARPITVTPTSSQAKVYGEADAILTYSFEASSTGRGLVLGDSFTGDLARAAGEDVSSYAISQGNLTNSNYAITVASVNFAITARPIYITADAGQTKVYGETDPILTYSTAAMATGSGLMGTDGVTLTGALARANGSDVGTTYAITQGGLATSSGSNYSIQYTGANFAISTRPVTVTPSSALTKVYGELDGTLTYTLEASSAGRGLVVGDSFTGALARAVGEDVSSSYAINQGSLANSNYAITFVPANFAISQRPISLTASSATKVYGDANPSLAVTVTSGSLASISVTDTSSQVTGTLSRDAGENVGNFNIVLGSGTKAANYAITFNASNQAMSISTRPITVTPSSGLTKVYGELDGTLTYTLEASSAGRGLVVGDSFTGALARAVGEDVSSSYAINQGSLANSNYAVSMASANFAITARPVYVSADAGQTKVYGETDPTFAYTTAAKATGSGLMGAYDGVTLTGALARASGADVATNYAINQGSLATSAGSNYSIQYTDANFAITAKPVVISSSNSGTTYDGVSTYEDFANAAGFSTNVPLIGSDAIGSFTQAVTVGGVAVSGIAQAGSFVATPSAAIMASGSASNYAFTYSATTNTVAKANLSITATASLSGNIYNGSAYTGTYTSTFLGADASLAVISGLATGTNVGAYASNIAVTGAVLDNYNAPIISDANLVISPRPIAITPTQVSKVEGDDDPVMEVTISAGSLAPTDNLSDVMAAISRTAGEEVASYDILMSLGAKAANYDISYDISNAAFSITDRPVVSTGSGVAGAILVIEDEESTRRGGRKDRRRSSSGRCFP
jgi:hypothetical protein